jgi:hypothetical protein
MDTKKINTNEISRANSIRFAATIKAAEADEYFDADKLPTEFAQAKELWEANDPKCLELLLGFIKCFFFKEHMDLAGDLDELFVFEDDENFIESNNLSFVSVDFSETNIPKFTAAAFFDFSLKKGVTREAIDEWQDEHFYLDEMICFEWKIPNLEDHEEAISWTLLTYRDLDFFIIEE